jgi:hypothetical protein
LEISTSLTKLEEGMLENPYSGHPITKSSFSWS